MERIAEFCNFSHDFISNNSIIDFCNGFYIQSWYGIVLRSIQLKREEDDGRNC